MFNSSSSTRLAPDYKRDMSQFRAIILIAVDDSEAAEYAFNWYRDYIHKSENYVVLIHCTDQNDQEIRDASPGRTAKIVKDLAEKLKKMEDKFGHLMEVNGMKGRLRKGTGKPGEAIVKAAVEEGAALIVTGSRGLGKLKRAFLGSVSDYVVHNSPVPVVTCRCH